MECDLIPIILIYIGGILIGSYLTAIGELRIFRMKRGKK